MPRLSALKPTIQPLQTRVARVVISERLRGRAAMARQQRIKARDLYTCAVCGRVTGALDVDHIVPLWQGGADVDGNLQCLCAECHATKTADEAAVRAWGGGVKSSRSNSPETARPPTRGKHQLFQVNQDGDGVARNSKGIV